MKRSVKILFVMLLAAPSVAAQEKTPAIDWQKMLAEVRANFAASQEPTLRQTRIDRAYFSLNEDDPDLPPYLNIKGVALRTALDDEKRMKEILRKELSKISLPSVKYVLKIDEIAFHESPIFALQSAAVAQRKTDASLNVFFEGATYAADGALQLHVLLLEDAPPAKIAKIYDENKPIAPELLKIPGSKVKTPLLLRRGYDWPAALEGLRKKFADDLDPLLNRTRLDSGHLAYSLDGKAIYFHVGGVCVHPPGLVADAERAIRWKKHVSGLIPKVTYEPLVAGVVMIDNPSLAWQDDAAAQVVHDGIFFHLARFDLAGEISIAVNLANDGQRAAALKMTQQKPAVAQLRFAGEKHLQMQLWPWQDVMPKAQERLAQGDFVQHRTRIDRAFLKYDDKQRGIPYLHMEGANLHPTEIEPAEKLRARLEPSFADLPPITFEHKMNLDGIRFLESPIYALQTEAVERSLDGLLFADGRYDDAGKLHLGIVIGAPDQRAIARKMVAAHPVPAGVIRPKDAKDQPIVEFTEIPWRDTLHQMQGWLARHNETLLKKSRLDRAFFSYPKSRIGPDLNMALVGIYPKKDALTARLKKYLQSYTNLSVTDQLRAGPVAVVPVIENLDNPATIVQTKISEMPALDGVRLDDASFDKNGKLLLHGFWAGKSQQANLDKFVQQILTPAHTVLKHGINFAPMQDFDSPALLLQLRTWIADQEAIDEVWLERFYFDELGKTRVSGFSTRPQDKEKAVRQLPKFLPRFDSQKLPPLEPDVKDAAPPKKKEVVPVAFLQEQKDDGPIVLDALPNIAQYLRDNIPKVAKCDGLRIDRCFYDPKGVLRIEGLADHAKHTEELKAFLDDEKAPFDRKRQLGRGWGEGRQIVIALRPMMVSLAENLPNLPEFDGLTLTRAHHDPKNQLVLTGHAVGNPDAKELAKTLKRLLETHPRWRLRTTFGVVLDITDKRPADVELANRLMYRALHLLQVNIGEAGVDPLPHAAIGWMSHAWPFDPRLPRALPTDSDYDTALQNLDAALLHNPKSVLAWYLRGYILQMKNRGDLSLRDFRRMAALEAEDRELRHKRILALELVQGSLRQSAFRIEQRALIEVADEWTLRILRESPAVPHITK
jgi:hypothetical protein